MNISIFFLLSSFLLVVVASSTSILVSSSSSTITELHWVRGCIEPTSPNIEERKASGCNPQGGQTITVRGKNFGRSGATVSLTLPRTVAGKIKHGQISFPCQQTRHSETLPTLIAFCTLPKFVVPNNNNNNAEENLKETFEKALSSKENGKSNTDDNNRNQQQDQQQDKGPKDSVSGLSYTTLVEKLLEEQGTLKLHVSITTRGQAQPSAILRNVVELASGKDGVSPQSTQTQQKALEKLATNMDWKSLGVGGLTKEVKQLIRRVISTRSSKEAVDLMTSLGLSHAKGVLLYGLPGCGKTLLAKKISEHLGASNVKVVNGPSLVSKFVGESEKNLRELFAPAQTDWERFGSRSPLHVIILDEVDAIMKTRHTNEETASGSTAIYDGLTTQMLAALDGLESVGNILVFALTNRKDSLDSALLRPGRFEVQLHLHLPNSKARQEILEIHAEKLRENKMLNDDVDFSELAEATPSFSGADLSGVIRSAVSFALQRTTEKFTKEMMGQQQKDEESSASSCSSSSKSSSCSGSGGSNKKKPEKVTMKDFFKGIAEIRATKGSVAADVPSRLLRRGIVPTAAHTPILQRLNTKLVQNFRHLPPKSFYRILLHGAPESGLSSIAASVCSHSFFDSVQILKSESLLSSTSSVGGGSSSPDKIADQLSKALQTAQEGNNACLVVDGADQLATAGEFSKGGVAQSMSTNVLKALRQILQSPVAKTDESEDFSGSSSSQDNNNDEEDAEKPQQGKVLIVMSVQSMSFVRSLVGSSALFDTEEHVSLLGPQDVARFLVAYGIFAPSQWRKAEMVASTYFASDIPVKRLLRVVDMVRSKMLFSSSDADADMTSSSTTTRRECRASPHPLRLLVDEKQKQNVGSETNLNADYFDGLSSNQQQLQKKGKKIAFNDDDEDLGAHGNKRRLDVCQGLSAGFVDAAAEAKFEKLLSESLNEAASAFHVDI